MKTTALNYRIIVEKEKQKKGYVYVAYAPSLGVSDFGKTLDKAIEHIEEAIRCYIEGLMISGSEVPEPDGEDYYVGRARVAISNELPSLHPHA